MINGMKIKLTYFNSYHCEHNIFLTDLETDRQTYRQEQWCVSFWIIDTTARLRLN